MDPDFCSLMLWMQIIKMMPALDSIFNTIKFLVKVKIENWRKVNYWFQYLPYDQRLYKMRLLFQIISMWNVWMELLINFKKVCVSSQKIILLFCYILLIVIQLINVKWLLIENYHHFLSLFKQRFSMQRRFSRN